MATDIADVSLKEEVICRRRKYDILDLVGGDGRWQRRIFLVLILAAITDAAHSLAMTFLAPNLDHWCSRPAGVANLSVQQWRRVGMPQRDQYCSRYTNINFTIPMKEDAVREVSSEYNTEPCDSWEYDKTLYSSTVLNQWDLVCNRQWLVSLSKSVYMAGNMASVTVVGYLSDKMGRKPAIVVSSFVALWAAIICAFSTSIEMFIASRFFVSLGLSGCYTTAFVLLMEVTGPKYRPVYGLASNFGWCLGFISLPAIAWVLRDWFWIQVTLTAPCIVLSIIWWMISESPRWLLAQGKLEEAQRNLSKAAKLNRREIYDIDSTLKEIMTNAREVHESGETKGNLLDLLKTPGIRQITLNLYFIWFVNAFVYFGLSFNTNELAGDPFVNFALSGAVEFPAYFVSIFAIRCLGRRKPLCASMVIGGMACLLSYLLPPDPWWLSVAVTMIGKFCITSSFGIIFVYTTELFPTVVRNLGLGSASFCARVGSTLAPFIKELGTATYSVVPQIIFGILAIVSGVFVLLLPETNKCNVPDTFKEAAEISRCSFKKRKLSEGNPVIKMFSNREALEDGIMTQAVFASSPKLRKTIANRLEEDSHRVTIRTDDIVDHVITTTNHGENSEKQAAIVVDVSIKSNLETTNNIPESEFSDPQFEQNSTTVALEISKEGSEEI